ncbi:MAG: gfo/Idh/MocA family oxidoreductase, partial [Prolixibacteraceae bacterium]
MENRRAFIKKASVSSAGITLTSAAFGFTAKSYKNIIGANDRIHVAAIGLNGRGNSMVGTIAKQKNTEVS